MKEMREGNRADGEVPAVDGTARIERERAWQDRADEWWAQTLAWKDFG